MEWSEKQPIDHLVAKDRQPLSHTNCAVTQVGIAVVDSSDEGEGKARGRRLRCEGEWESTAPKALTHGESQFVVPCTRLRARLLGEWLRGPERECGCRKVNNTSKLAGLLSFTLSFFFSLNFPKTS